MVAEYTPQDYVDKMMELTRLRDSPAIGNTIDIELREIELEAETSAILNYLTPENRRQSKLMYQEAFQQYLNEK